jgi:organic radical activating enzyme
MSKSTKLVLAETFTSIQGEGHLSGKRTFFIRFAGCTVASCPLHPSNENLCDTNWSPKSVITDLDALADEALAVVGVGGWVTITGGEPSDQLAALNELAVAVRKRSMQLNIQTSGTRIIPCPWDWLTVSPKGTREQIAQNFGQELKIVYRGQGLDELREWHQQTKFWNYYLMPCWAHGTCNMAETIEAVHAAGRAGLPFELTTQVHKWAGIR